MDTKGPGGAPSKYKEEYADQGYKLCLLGFTDTQMAEFWEVCEATINNWKIEHPEFLESIKKGKAIADADVAVSLHSRAMGYSHPEDKILSNPTNPNEPIIVPTTKHYPPDTTACAIWLNNRQRGYWSQKPHEQLTTDVDADIDEKFL